MLKLRSCCFEEEFQRLERRKMSGLQVEQLRKLDDEMPVEAKVDGKDEQSTKPDDSTVGEAVTTASVEG
ncbi:hypothetical protein Tco_0299373 [Tanacetum coccineum]